MPQRAGEVSSPLGIEDTRVKIESQDRESRSRVKIDRESRLRVKRRPALHVGGSRGDRGCSVTEQHFPGEVAEGWGWGSVAGGTRARRRSGGRV